MFEDFLITTSPSGIDFCISPDGPDHALGTNSASKSPHGLMQQRFFFLLVIIEAQQVLVQEPKFLKHHRFVAARFLSSRGASTRSASGPSAACPWPRRALRALPLHWPERVTPGDRGPASQLGVQEALGTKWLVGTAVSATWASNTGLDTQACGFPEPANFRGATVT